MSLQLYNTLTQTIEIFSSRVSRQVGLYVCGPTAYGRIHIGNARPYIVIDVLHRILRRSHTVQYVRNITDLDDKIIEASARLQCSPDRLTEQSIYSFRQDMDTLGVLPPTDEPLATNHIPEMLLLIQILLKKGHAYEVQGHVFFDTTSFKDYGKLSRRNPTTSEERPRIEADQYKRNQHDFILWKPSRSQQPGWESPWGVGRPGWHIECSAMSWKYLGVTFDIHAGGQDLIFPHHENEIAQSQGVHGPSTFAHYWIHNGILWVNGQKMSKSLGNYLTVSDLMSMPETDGETIRLALLSTHYRKPLDFNQTLLKQARSVLNKFYSALFEETPHLSETSSNDLVCPNVLMALENDLNTPLAVAHLHQIAHTIRQESLYYKRTLLREKLKQSAYLLGLLGKEPDKKLSLEKENAISEAHIESLVKAREHARKLGDFKLSDAIRDQLLSQGVVVTDLKEGKILRRV